MSASWHKVSKDVPDAGASVPARYVAAVVVGNALEFYDYKQPESVSVKPLEAVTFNVSATGTGFLGKC